MNLTSFIRSHGMDIIVKRSATKGDSTGRSLSSTQRSTTQCNSSASPNSAQLNSASEASAPCAQQINTPVRHAVSVIS
jgi:hypothetical protein